MTFDPVTGEEKEDLVDVARQSNDFNTYHNHFVDEGYNVEPSHVDEIMTESSNDPSYRVFFDIESPSEETSGGIVILLQEEEAVYSEAVIEHIEQQYVTQVDEYSIDDGGIELIRSEEAHYPVGN